jgi:hypothetical protein
MPLDPDALQVIALDLLLHPEEIAAIDRLRGVVPRDEYLREVIRSRLRDVRTAEMPHGWQPSAKKRFVAALAGMGPNETVGPLAAVADMEAEGLTVHERIADETLAKDTPPISSELREPDHRPFRAAGLPPIEDNPLGRIALRDGLDAGKSSSPWPPTGTRAVKGHCPHGCGETLFVSTAGEITCSAVDCPKPTSVSVMLSDKHIHQHVVVFADDGFSVQHPLSERNGAKGLDRCELHEYLTEYLAPRAGPPVSKGTWLAERGSAHSVAIGLPWRFVKIT